MTRYDSALGSRWDQGSVETMVTLAAELCPSVHPKELNLAFRTSAWLSLGLAASEDPTKLWPTQSRRSSPSWCWEQSSHQTPCASVRDPVSSSPHALSYVGPMMVLLALTTMSGCLEEGGENRIKACSFCCLPAPLPHTSCWPEEGW